MEWECDSPRGKQQNGVNRDNFYFNLLSYVELLREVGGHLGSFTLTTNQVFQLGGGEKVCTEKEVAALLCELKCIL